MFPDPKTALVNNAAYMAEITAVHGTSPGPASGIRYSARAIGAQDNIVVTNALPFNQRPSDATSIVAAAVGDICFIAVRSGKPHLQVWEGVHVVDCSEVAP